MEKVATLKAMKQVISPSFEEMWVWKIWEKCSVSILKFKNWVCESTK